MSGVRLKRRSGTERLDLGAGVAVFVSHCGQPERDLAEARAATAARELAKGARSFADYGLEALEGGVGDLIDGGDDAITGFGQHLLATELGLIVIKDWEGVLPPEPVQVAEGEKEPPAEITRLMVALLMSDVVVAGSDLTYANVFLAKAMVRTALIRLEKKSS